MVYMYVHMSEKEMLFSKVRLIEVYLSREAGLYLFVES